MRITHRQIKLLETLATLEPATIAQLGITRGTFRMFYDLACNGYIESVSRDLWQLTDKGRRFVGRKS